MSELTHAVLPLYTPSEPSPIYSCNPSCNERTLQHTPRPVRPTPTGTYVKRSGKLTLTLYEQEDGIDMPLYGRHGDVTGSLLIEDPHKVCQVTMKIEGILDTTISESGSKSIPLMNRSYTLWRKGESDELSGFLAFSHLLPSTFSSEGVERPLPPSYREDQCKTSAFFLRTAYSITVFVSRPRSNMEFLTKTDQIKIPFKYYPRTRAHRPILQNPGFFSSVKTSPDEWYQTVSELKTRTPLIKLDPIHCHLFIPGARVYGLNDKIPFHVQLNGPLDALQQLLMPQRADAPPQPSWSTKKSNGKCPLHDKPSIRVYLLRQHHIETRGYKSWKNTIIGEGQVWELPPAICETRGVHLDWAGEVKLDESVTVGGFSAGNVTVRDFIVLGLEPPTIDKQPSPFLSVQMNVPIRFVSDSYVEVTEYELTTV